MKEIIKKKSGNKSDFFKKLKLKLFFSEMPISKVLTQTTLAGLLIAIAAIIERFAMIKAGPFEICFGFFVVLLFPLLLDFRISIIAALISITITELLISGEGTFWIHYLPILLSFPVIKIFMLFNKKWFFAIGLLMAMTLYVLVASLEMKIYMGKAFGAMFMLSKTIQMLVAIPVALVLYYPIKKVIPNNTENSWEKATCCGNCKPSVNKNHKCCDDNCEDGCKGE